MRTGLRTALAAGLALAFVACGPDAADDAEAPPAEQTGMQGMAGMEGMEGMGSASAMGAEMAAHMERMQGASEDTLMLMMPDHRQMLGNMMGQMNREMEGMNMAADPQWSALADSLRDDLVRMPEMSGAQMQAFMPGHHARVSRLMEMHGGMMGGM